MAKHFNLTKFNKILKEYNQQLQAEKITGKEIILSNGLILTAERDIRLCKKRVMSGTDIWKKTFDRLYSLTPQERIIAEKECRKITSKQGGINCQQTHGNRIKNNLNTGNPWNKGLKGNYPYSYSLSIETKEKISLANRGKNNGMYGKEMSEEQKEYRSKLMKQKILSGEFTPNSNNRNTHWNAFFNGKKYRSSWEALYQYFDITAEYEALRIPYRFNNKDFIYIIDFVNHKHKTLIEVKPEELTKDKKTQAKISAAKNWCEQNGYFFILADKKYLLSFPKPTNFEEFDNKTQMKIKKLYETCK